MNNFKNLLIATLTGLLALSLFSQPAQSAPKTYDAVKLIAFEHCLSGYQGSSAQTQNALNECSRFRP
jgi:hypothetical protein